jgi:hypothetical protein
MVVPVRRTAAIREVSASGSEPSGTRLISR